MDPFPILVVSALLAGSALLRRPQEGTGDLDMYLHVPSREQIIQACAANPLRPPSLRVLCQRFWPKLRWRSMLNEASATETEYPWPGLSTRCPPAIWLGVQLLLLEQEGKIKQGIPEQNEVEQLAALTWRAI